MDGAEKVRFAFEENVSPVTQRFKTREVSLNALAKAFMDEY
ncbi:hypothetical protein [Veronia pacifica]|nr:hypothetical protein [Veronia pacifica]